MTIPASLQPLTDRIIGYGQRTRRYSIVLFIILVGGLYGFVSFRITTLHTEEPSQDAISEQVGTKKLTHIDPAVVRQLQQLQDNSVNVQTLFDQARTTPFQ